MNNAMSTTTRGLLQRALFESRLCPAEIAGIAPDELEAIHQLALSYLDTQRYDEACALMKGLLVLFPLNSTYWRSLGITLHSQRKYRNAIETYNIARLLQPQDIYSRVYQAECYFAINDLRNAYSNIENIKDIPPALAKRRDQLWVLINEMTPNCGTIDFEPMSPGPLADEITQTAVRFIANNLMESSEVTDTALLQLTPPAAESLWQTESSYENTAVVRRRQLLGRRPL